jgi:hypothetical protein
VTASPALFDLPPQPALQVRQHADLTREELQLIARAGLDGLAPAEAWTVAGSNQQLSYATHGVFRFFGKFPPPIASHLLAAHTVPGDLVIDPMCGSGTTGVECILANRRSLLGDVNPLALLLARVKTRRISERAFDAAVTRVAREYRPLSPHDSDFAPLGLRNPDHWFLPETSNSLRGIRYLVEREPNEEIREALQVAFASTVRRVSRATTQQGRLFLDVTTALPDALKTFLDRAGRIIKALRTLPVTSCRTDVLHVDMRQSQIREQAPLVILHPPYFNSYRYSSINSLELAWLGISRRDVQKAEVREFFKVGKEENVTRYLEDMTSVLANASELLAPGGVLALMIGDTTLRNHHIRVVQPLLDRLPEDLTLNRIAVRVPRFTEATWVASQRRNGQAIGVKLMDFVLTFRKVPA